MKTWLTLLFLATAGASKAILLPDPERMPEISEEPLKLDMRDHGGKPPSSATVSPTRANFHRMTTASSLASNDYEKIALGIAIGANSDILQHLSSGSALSPSVCSGRLEALRSLVDAGMYKDALFVSAALTSEDRAELDDSCELEEVSFSESKGE